MNEFEKSINKTIFSETVTVVAECYLQYGRYDVIPDNIHFSICFFHDGETPRGN